MKDIAYIFRLFLVRLGKNVPFILVIALLICNIESTFSYFMERYVDEGNGVLMLDNSISWFMSPYIDYNWLTIILLLSMSYGLKCCWRNKLAIFYLMVNLIEKDIIESGCIDFKYIPYILISNIIVMMIILGLGLNLLCNNLKKKNRCVRNKR